MPAGTVTVKPVLVMLPMVGAPGAAGSVRLLAVRGATLHPALLQARAE